MEPYSETDLTGLVFDVQHYSLDDGPGIRTTVFLKGCPLSCKWCQNPESIKPEPEIGFRAERCIGCGACRKTCPNNAIAFDSTDRIDRIRCTVCGACAEVCPSRAMFVVGKRYSVPKLLEEVQRDTAFYEESGGGVTLSGGEPTLQIDFIVAFVRACKEAGLNTAIETNGLTPSGSLRKLLPYLDGIYFDLKIINPVEHRRLTGADNRQILENARMLAECGAPVNFRLPLVPLMTANKDNVRAISAFLTEVGAKEIELCPYHENWVTKLVWLGRRQSPPAELQESLTTEELLSVIDMFSQEGINARSVEGEIAAR
ncbi:MAG: glycyl-radical enzyme activating protein [Candidatus Lindowbacteria bacterium]|nr:glycyl-radical enzyme activating protein [Candidatus Lindowbacteria bacterium]